MKKCILLFVAIITSLFISQKAEAQEKGVEHIYPATLPTMSFVGLTSSCDGTVDGRRNTLATLWKDFGNSQVFNKDNAIYRKKIYVIYYNHLPQRESYSIFIGYAFFDWLGNRLIVNNQSSVILDIPRSNYLSYDVRGTSANSIIKAWDEFYQMYPNDVNDRAMEVYTLDSNDYNIQNVTIYLKKKK